MAAVVIGEGRRLHRFGLPDSHNGRQLPFPVAQSIIPPVFAGRLSSFAGPAMAGVLERSRAAGLPTVRTQWVIGRRSFPSLH